MKMTRFNKSNLPALRADLNDALRVVAEKYGLEIAVGSCRYQTNSASWKVETSILGENGENKKDEADWNSYAIYRGFSKEDLGVTFTDYSGGDFVGGGYHEKRM